jgi:hypothetical protein
MRYYRIWSDSSGESHIEELSVQTHPVLDYAPGVPPVDVSPDLSTKSGHFSRLPASWFGDWHPAPSRQLVVLLQGRLEVTTSDGVMTGGPGTAWLVEDTFGRGHQTRVVGDEDAVRFSVLLAD